MADIKIDQELLQALNIVVSGAMATGNCQLLPAINKVTNFVNIVIEANKKPIETEEVKEDE